MQNKSFHIGLIRKCYLVQIVGHNFVTLPHLGVLRQLYVLSRCLTHHRVKGITMQGIKIVFPTASLVP